MYGLDFQNSLTQCDWVYDAIILLPTEKNMP